MIVFFILLGCLVAQILTIAFVLWVEWQHKDEEE